MIRATFISLLSLVMIPASSQHKIVQWSVLGGMEKPLENFASATASNPQSYFASDGWGVGLRYGFLLFSQRKNLLSFDKNPQFVTFCPGDYSFLLGYFESEFFVEYHHAQWALNPNIISIYKTHYFDNAALQKSSPWQKNIISIGTKLRYALEVPLRCGFYVIASVGTGMLQAPTYTFAIENQRGQQVPYQVTYTLATILNTQVGLGIECNLGNAMKFFIESSLSTDFSDGYTTTVKGLIDGSTLQYQTGVETQNVSSKLGLSYRIR